MRHLTLQLVAFVTDFPSPAIELAVRHAGVPVLVISPPQQREHIERVGATWFNMTLAEDASARWADRYQHSSFNELSYERFCLQRWLMLRKATTVLALPADAAIACLDSDVLLFRDPALWLAELRQHSMHALAQATTLVSGGVVLFSPSSLSRFGHYLEWLYAQTVANVAVELQRFGIPGSLDQVEHEMRHRPSKALLREFGRSSPRSIWMWSDIEALDAFCTRSAEGSLAAGLRGARCSRACLYSLADVRSAAVAGRHDAMEGLRPNCSIQAVALAPPSGLLQLYMTEPLPPDHRDDDEPHGQQASPLPPANATDAAHWARALRWRVGSPPFVPDLFNDDGLPAISGGLQRRRRFVCFAHLQGPTPKETLMSPMTAQALQHAQPVSVTL